MADLVCKSFKLGMAQQYIDPQNGTLDTDRFELDVFDTGDQHYILPVSTIPNEVDLICLILRRIANAGGQPGWKFKGTFVAPGPGTITG